MPIDRGRIAEVRKKRKVTRLALCGPVPGNDFRPGSAYESDAGIDQDRIRLAMLETDPYIAAVIEAHPAHHPCTA